VTEPDAARARTLAVRSTRKSAIAACAVCESGAGLDTTASSATSTPLTSTSALSAMDSTSAVACSRISTSVAWSTGVDESSPAVSSDMAISTYASTASVLPIACAAVAASSTPAMAAAHSAPEWYELVTVTGNVTTVEASCVSST
jgi:hypothetical protein